MEERRRVRVAEVDLIPDVTKIARVEVAGDERGLARPGWRGQPDDRSRRSFVEEREQPRTRKRVVELGPREFGESGRASGQGVLQAERMCA
jgi:hypothetical protein